jgi:phosphoenolpyruvate carboxykinase (GTP)
MPRHSDLDWTGLEDFTDKDFCEAMSLDREDWDREILSYDELFIKLNDRISREMVAIKELTLSSLWRSPEHWEMTPDPI